MKTEIKNQKQKKTKIALLCIGIGLIGIGAGVGIGYGIIARPNNDVKDFTMTTKPNGNMQLRNAGDEAYFKVSLSKETDVDVKVEIYPNSEFAYLFDEGTLAYKDGNPVTEKSDTYWTTIPKGATETTFGIVMNTNEWLDDDAVIAEFILTSHPSTSTLGYPVIKNSAYVVLENGSAKPIVVDNNVRNFVADYSDLVLENKTNMSAEYTKFNEYIDNHFSALPTISDVDKVDLSSYTSPEDMINELHKYDNAESEAAIILLDYALSYISGSAWWEQVQYAKISINHITSTPTDEQPNGPKLFDMSFMPIRWSATDEKGNTLYCSEHENWTGTWWMTFTYGLNFSNGDMRTDFDSYAVGLYNDWGNILDPESTIDQTFKIQALKHIYAGVVSVWPPKWS